MTKLSFPRHLQVIRVRLAPAAMQILVIEDEPRILAFLARGLEAEGFGVDAAENGPAGLKRALTSSYDAVILDLLLPGLDGLSVLRQLQLRLPDVPVVIVSARSDLATKLRSFGLGANDYIPKPFALDELIARLRVQLRRNAVQHDDTLLHAGTLTLDLARRQARIGELVADLSDREFRVLHHLVEHAGTIVSRERLLAEVWGYHFDPCSNVVEVCVRRLRVKLGEEAPIETVRHAGYRLNAA